MLNKEENNQAKCQPSTAFLLMIDTDFLVDLREGIEDFSIIETVKGDKSSSVAGTPLHQRWQCLLPFPPSNPFVFPIPAPFLFFFSSFPNSSEVYQFAEHSFDNYRHRHKEKKLRSYS
ncbi:hypothetical protein RRG08_047030 [Elysia crispata]|uniref:Uncharacterized protein n=1 Tax=Elysia crispata TaxID=231223 RepID=A0AAE1AVF9_9GAST|nr:hypothetical protein RRG08_047030 [Elysia crispata]